MPVKEHDLWYHAYDSCIVAKNYVFEVAYHKIYNIDEDVAKFIKESGILFAMLIPPVSQRFRSAAKFVLKSQRYCFEDLSPSVVIFCKLQCPGRIELFHIISSSFRQSWSKHIINTDNKTKRNKSLSNLTQNRLLCYHNYKRSLQEDRSNYLKSCQEQVDKSSFKMLNTSFLSFKKREHFDSFI